LRLRQIQARSLPATAWSPLLATSQGANQTDYKSQSIHERAYRNQRIQ
jgi:hypothetical protein